MRGVGYNDNLRQPQFKEWIGKIVEKEGEDATRRDKWCCMMYPRLALLRELLRDDCLFGFRLVRMRFVSIWRLWIAYRRYLQFPHALATVAASQIIVGLLAAVIILNL